MYDIKEITEHDKTEILIHLLRLDQYDRRCRFGIVVTDDYIFKYVSSLDWKRDYMFGIFYEKDLLAFGHLAISTKTCAAEFGVSLDESARNIGLGRAMLQHAVYWAESNNFDKICTQCLFENGPMIHVARALGMKVVIEDNEVGAYIDLTK